ncbi:ALI_HP2_G0051070.mRNA.1.CDS.1 [Saccharomyces cerevisiae]|nr:ALI_HP2_G0051070.mRNA.1.CDS.1 [Saccharomyces cerevisiae]CAI6785155.1 ALI_HP2_G0051070.mRNA.1.CDS.1 [Saccharomyces cerevisiae]CAI6797495.1 ALI_HP1_G0051800.mRNA.1.CDS.1 [Saccharomyces cerevisiae]CAI6898785.1 ALI_collapsed_G0053440.mRNA.1.CDS.1 [Saccharomyces cerevisiae]
MSSDSLTPKDTIVPEEQTNQLRQPDLDEDSIHYDPEADDLESLETTASYASTLVSAKVYTKKEVNKGTDIESQPHWGENTSSTHDSDKEEDSNEEIESFPEGGFKAWVVTFGCFLGLIACFGLLNSTGVIENHLQDNQLSSESVSTIGWLFSLFLFVCFASCIISGTYFDRNGFRTIMIVGTVFHVAGLFATANSTKYWHFILSFAIVCGFGNGIVLSPLVSVPAHYFFKRRGTALAMATIGGSVGGVVFPIMLRSFFSMKSDTDPTYGFVWGIRTLGFLDLALLTLSIILVKERLPHVIENSKDGESRWRYILRVYILQCFDAKAFLDMKYLFCVLGTVFGELSINSALTYYGSYATSHGISANDAYTLIMIINVCGIPGRWVPGYLSDKFGRFNVAIATLLTLFIVMFVGWLPFGTNLTNMYVISALYGFCSGSVFSLLPVCCGQISKTEEFGKRYSTMYFVVAFGTLVGIPITGAIISNKTTADYQHYIIFCGLATFVSAVCYIISRAYCVGFKWVRF